MMIFRLVFFRLLLGGLALFVSFFPAVLLAEQSYNVETIAVSPFSQQIKRTGVVAFKRTLDLSFGRRGYLAAVVFDEGQQFPSNALLASLDTVTLKAEKNIAYVRLQQAKRDVERLQTLTEQALSYQQALELAKTEVAVARSAYQVAYYYLEKAEIRAPFAGIVIKRYADVEQLLLPGQALLTVAALNNNSVVQVALTGQEIGQVSLGQSVTVKVVTANPQGESLSGTISKIPAVASSNHLFMIEVLLTQGTIDSGIFAGQRAEVLMNISQDRFSYAVPIEALMSIDASGKALVMSKFDQQQDFLPVSFPILALDDDFLYLAASAQAQALIVMTKGWHKFSVIEQ